MIPKKIHYCWFGRGEKPKLAEKCIASWKKYCPDYEIIEWNEDNFDMFVYPYTKYFLETQKYAFLSDLVRLIVIFENGGLYFDTDVELLKRPDDLLENEAFFGFETPEYINTGHGFGATKHHPVIKEMIQSYMELRPDENGEYHPIGCPTLNTQALVALGLLRNGQRQCIKGAEIYLSVLARLASRYTYHVAVMCLLDV